MEQNNNGKLNGKLILKAKIKNTSPMLIASGKGDEIDFEVIKDSNGNPFIPGSGFAGMLKNSFNTVELSREQKEQLEYFWGSEDTNKSKPSQSHIIIDDLKIEGKYKIIERDGVAINPKTNLGIDGSKFDYELIEQGASFLLNAEITLRDGFDKAVFLNFIYFIIQNGIVENYQQGAFKSSGFGMLKWEYIEIFEFNFPDDSTLWFEYLQSKGKPKSIFDHKKININLKANKLIFSGEFSIKNSLIIRSEVDETKYSNEHAPDKTHLKDTDGNALLTAKSVRGAIRHRALKILNTLDIKDAEKQINNLFGYVKNENGKPEAEKGRLKTFETKIKKEEVEMEQIQTRIKIDRFTGGTIDSALMQTQPLWHKDETFTLKFEIENCQVGC